MHGITWVVLGFHFSQIGKPQRIEQADLEIKIRHKIAALENLKKYSMHVDVAQAQQQTPPEVTGQGQNLQEETPPEKTPVEETLSEENHPTETQPTATHSRELIPTDNQSEENPSADTHSESDSRQVQREECPSEATRSVISNMTSKAISAATSSIRRNSWKKIIIALINESVPQTRRIQISFFASSYPRTLLRT